MILAPLRGVTIRCFRETFADELAAAGFTEAVTPFISAMAGVDPLRDRELKPSARFAANGLRLTPQFIGKDPEAFRLCLQRIRDAGYETADLNCGCPFPMVRNKGRGSGILRTPKTLERMLEVGCTVMGEGKFSVKTRLGVDRPDELLALMPTINRYPLRFLTVHARTARQMYAGSCDRAAFEQVAAVASVPLVYNGDVTLPPPDARFRLMVGRGFVRALGLRADSEVLARRYLEASQAELNGDRPVLGRLKEFLSYWRDLPRWNRSWATVKLCRSVEELSSLI